MPHFSGLESFKTILVPSNRSLTQTGLIISGSKLSSSHGPFSVLGSTKLSQLCQSPSTLPCPLFQMSHFFVRYFVDINDIYLLHASTSLISVAIILAQNIITLFTLVIV